MYCLVVPRFSGRFIFRSCILSAPGRVLPDGVGDCHPQREARSIGRLAGEQIVRKSPSHPTMRVVHLGCSDKRMPAFVSSPRERWIDFGSIPPNTVQACYGFRWKNCGAVTLIARRRPVHFCSQSTSSTARILSYCTRPVVCGIVVY